jgi:hypothetical protein
MANVSVDTNVSNIVVSTSQSNITVSDDGVIVSNITVLESNINVGTTQNIINVAEVAAVSDADVRAALGNTAPILYNVSTGIFSFDSNAAFSGKTTDDLAEGSTNLYYTNARVDARVPTSILNSNITLKQYSDTVFDNGNISGNVTINVANGAMHKANITGNITGISVANVAAGTSLLVVLEQDAIGLAYLDTTTFASNWTNWKFVNDDTALNAAPNGVSYLGIVYDGEYYHLSVLTDASDNLIPNSQLANSNVIINGITIPLGSSATLTTANIAENTNLYFTAARARGNVSATDAGGLGSFTYNSATGIFTYTGPSDSDVRNLLSNTSPITYNSGTGAIGLSGTANITTTGNISGGFILGNGSLLTGVTSLTNAQVIANIATQPLTVGGNLTVTGDATISGNDITVANILIPGSEVTSGVFAGWTNQGLIRIPGGGNVIIGPRNGYSYNAIDIPGNPTFPIAFGKAIYSPYAATFEQGVIGGGFFADFGTSISTGTGNIHSNQGGDIYSTNMGSSPTGRSGNIYTLTGNILGAYLHGDGSNITGISSLTNAQVVSYIATQPLTVGGNLTVNGNINATGNINVQNVEDLYVRDQTIVMNANAASPANVQIVSNRPGFANTELKWNEQSTRWEFTNNGTTYYPIPTSTSDLAEGTNLYYTTQRVRSNISVTVGSPSGNGNLSYDNSNGVFTFTPADTSAAGTVTQINTGENLTGGPITATGTIGMANALANVSTITAEATKNIVLNTANALVTQQKYNNTDVFSGNISSDGYAFFAANNYAGNAVSAYSGVANIENFVFNTGNTTVGSNAIIGVSLYQYADAATAANISNVAVNSLFTVNENSPYPFPQNTVVTSVDAANSTIYMSANAESSVNLTLTDSIAFFLGPVLLDITTGQAIAVYSQFDATGSGSKTTLQSSQPLFTSKYGYPKSGFSIGDFDLITAGVAGNYTLGNITNNFIGRNKVESPTSIFQAPRGLVVGNADLTSRAENDSLPSFGISVLWDGLANVATDYAGNTPATQLLLKQYSDNSSQATTPTTFGPRLFFTSSRGNKNLPYTETYPRKDDELGRITWWGSTSILASPGTPGPPGWISGVAGQDNLTTNSGLGMYFGISPNTNNFNRSLYLAGSMGNTLVASAQDSTGTHRPIIFAPSYFASSQGNSVLLYNQTVTGTDTIIDTTQTSGAHFAQINFNDTANRTGAKVSVTNGNNFNSNREGNIALSIDRNSTTANTTVRSRQTGTQVNYLGSSSPDRIRFTLAPDGLANATPVTISGFTNTTVAGALNGNVFYVKGPFITGSFSDYEIYTDSGLTTGVNLGVTNISAGPGNITYARTNGVTAKDWSWVLPQSSNSLVLTEDDVIRTTFEGANITTAGNITAGYFLGNGSQLTGLTTTQVTEGTNLYYTNALARASISGTGDISYDANTGVISYIGTPGDITDVIAGDGLTGGGTSGNVTLTVGAGTGITVNADNVAVNMGAFTTTNLAEGSNLYYTDTRANSAIDTRVNKAFVEGLGVSYTSLTDKPSIPTHTSNLTNDSGFITSATANVISVNTKTGTVVLNTGDIAESGNSLYFSNARARQSISGTGDISYDANTGVISYIGTPGDITDVIAGDGLTGGGSSGNVTLNVGAGTGITVNADNIAVNISAFSTTDLAEGTNLYYTTDRANTAIDTRVNKAFVEGLGVSYTSLTDKPVIPTHTSNLVNDSGFITTATANVVSVNGQTGVVTLNTSNIAEGTNLYYTSDRANTAIGAYQGAISTPGNINAGNITVGNINAGQLLGNGVQITAITGANVFGLVSTQVTEGTNLYFTTDRANSAIGTRLSSYNAAIISSANISTTANISGGNISTTGIVGAGNFQGDGSQITGLTTTQVTEGTNLYYSNTRVNAFIQNNITTSDIAEGANLYFTTNRANTAIDNRVTKSFVETLAISYTSLANTPTNVSAFTNDAGYLVAANLASLTANVTSVNGQAGVVSLDTSNIPENGNLYFTAARANSNVVAHIATVPLTVGGNLTVNGNINATGNINVQNVEDLYVRDQTIVLNANAASPANVQIVSNRPGFANTELKWNEQSDSWTFTNDGTTYYNLATSTSDVAEGTNLYYTDTRANAAIDTRVNKAYVDALGVNYNSLANVPTNVSAFTNDAGYLVAANLASLTANVTSVNGQTGVVVLDSDDVAEGSTNFYYSNTRVNAFIQDNITTSDIDEGTNLYYTSARANTAIGAYQGNINTTGTITAGAFTGDGSDLTDVRADTVEEKVINKSGGTLAKGTPVFATGGVTADVLHVAACDAGNAATMPCVGILATSLANDAEGRAIVIGRISGVDTSAFAAGDQLYVAVGGGYANVAPTGENRIIQGLGVVTRVNASQGGGIVNVVAENSTPNLNNGNVFIGNSSNVAVTTLLNTSIVPEGANLYFTTTRANSAIGAYQGNINTAGTLRANSVTVHGTTNVSLQVYDGTLGTNATGMYFNVGSATNNNAGFGVLRPTGADTAFLLWDEATDTWKFNNGNSTFYNMATSTTDLAEGTNLYFTTDRANTNSNAWLTTKTTTDLVEGANLYFSNARVVSAVQSSNITLKQFQETRVDLGTTSGNITLNMANGSIFAMTANGNISNIALSNAGVGASGTLIITQDGTGSRLLTVTSAWKFAGASKTLSTAANTIDIVNFFTDGTTVFAALSKGYA